MAIAGEHHTVLFLCSGNYYRSRYAEIAFNSIAPSAGLAWRATSAGLLPEHFVVNTGPISPTVLRMAASRGHPVPDPHRPPRAVSVADFRAATRIIALKESEHRPIVEARFSEWTDRVEYWTVHDVDVADPKETLPLLESAVLRLVAELRTPSRSAPPRGR
jgi:protein-tyrosine phosphatase